MATVEIIPERISVRSISCAGVGELGFLLIEIGINYSDMNSTDYYNIQVPYRATQMSVIAYRQSSDSLHTPITQGTQTYTLGNTNEYIYRPSLNDFNISGITSGGFLSGQTSNTGYYMGLVIVKTADNYFIGDLDRHGHYGTSQFVSLVLPTATSFGYIVDSPPTAGDDYWSYGITKSAFNYTSVNNTCKNIYNNSDEFVENTDPYESQSGSGGGGGSGLDSVSGSDVSDPDLPELSAVSTGLVSIFTPSLAQLQALGDFLWSDLFSLDTFKKIFTDPWDAILGLSILGVGVTGGTSSVVNIGNVSTGVSMPKLSTQYYKFNCGSITLNETWGSYLDYNPYTKVSIYLPFIGTHALNVDDIMGKTISLKYNIDILSGACVANIQCGGTVLYSFTGSCSATIPLSGSSYTNMINGILGIATSIGASVATGGAMAPVTAGTIIGSTMNMMKTEVSRTGNVSGMSGIMGVKSAYLIMEVPRICVPKNQNRYIGYPTYVTKKVGSLSGYCVFEDIKVRGNSHATMGEIEEIEEILKTGVYL